MNFEFLMVARTEVATSELLRELLQETLTANFDEISLDALTYNIRLTVQRPAVDVISDSGERIPRIICGFDLILPETTPYLVTVVSEFADALLNTDGVYHIVKFFDESLLEQNIVFARELFALEMSLRKAFSIIYLAAYRDGYYDLLRDEVVSILKKDGQSITEKEMKEAFENEFFHLLFSQYIGLNKRPQSKPDHLINLIQSLDSYEAVKNELARIPIENELDRDFLASLRAILDPVERLRNSIAHNRTPSDKLVENFGEAKKALEEGLKLFFAQYHVDADS